MATIAYWDTEQRGRPPPLLGDFQGTPTIRLFKPKKKQSKMGSNAEKVVVDYRQERKVKDLQQFVEDQMPNHVERISFGEEDYLKKAQAKAAKYGLPQAIFFTSKPQTTALLKYLSTEFRRRLLVVHVPPTTKNQKLLDKFGLGAGDGTTIPALIVVTPDGKQIPYSGEDFTRRKVERFLEEHAAKEPVYKPVVPAAQLEEDNTTKNDPEEEAATAKSEKEEPNTKPKVHVEL